MVLSKHKLSGDSASSIDSVITKDLRLYARSLRHGPTVSLASRPLLPPPHHDHHLHTLPLPLLCLCIPSRLHPCRWPWWPCNSTHQQTLVATLPISRRPDPRPPCLHVTMSPCLQRPSRSLGLCMAMPAATLQTSMLCRRQPRQNSLSHTTARISPHLDTGPRAGAGYRVTRARARSRVTGKSWNAGQENFSTTFHHHL